jgi:fructose-bisphosphate aldolase, class II
MLANLIDLLPSASSSDYIVPAFNVFGMDEAWQVTMAAEEERSPVILMVNKDMVRIFPVEVLGAMLTAIGSDSDCPVCVHLDHAYEESIIFRAMDAGFTSVMFDGSQLDLEENVRRTKSVAEAAHDRGISVEGEIGSVPYPDDGGDIKDERTAPEQALDFSRRSGVDAMAVSIGNVHKLKNPTAVIDRDLLRTIESLVAVPLVLHGASGISSSDLKELKKSRVAKCNIGTALRQAWGNTLRREFARQPEAFDRLTLTRKALEAVHLKAIEKIRELGSAGRA